MAKTKSLLLIPILLLVLLQIGEAKTPPGIAKNPSHATCKIKKYKHCYNLEHVCPKFCPDQCTVECASCKPICVGASSPPPQADSTPPTSPSLPTPSPSSPTPSTPYTPSPSSPSPTPSTTSPTTPSPKPPSTTPSPSAPSPTPSTPSTTPKPSSPYTPSPPTTTPSPKPPSTTPSSPTPSTPAPTPSTPSPTPPSTPPTSPSPSPSPSTPSTPSPSTPTPPTTAPSSPTSPTPQTSPTPSSPTSPSYPSPSPPTSSPPPDQSSSAGARRARCRNQNYPQCYNTEYACPSSCPTGCEVDCVTCKPVCNCDQPGAVCQDPRFIGGDGITFYFHGKKDHDFCLLSDPNLHINAHFIGKRNPSMTRDFTWVQSIGILFGKHQLFLGALKTAKWDDSVDRLAVAFDGAPISLPQSEGASWQSKSYSPNVSLVRSSDTNSFIVVVEGSFRITAKVVPITKEDSRIHNYGITEDDSFAHLDLQFKFFSLSDQVSGVLGQTYRPDYVSRVSVGAKMPVMGGEREFKSSSLFASDCAVARFKGVGYGDGDEDSLEGLKLPSLSCSTGLDGQGVVCKK